MPGCCNICPVLCCSSLWLQHGGQSGEPLELAYGGYAVVVGDQESIRRRISLVAASYPKPQAKSWPPQQLWAQSAGEADPDVAFSAAALLGAGGSCCGGPQILLSPSTQTSIPRYHIQHPHRIASAQRLPAFVHAPGMVAAPGGMPPTSALALPVATDHATAQCGAVRVMRQRSHHRWTVLLHHPLPSRHSPAGAASLVPSRASPRSADFLNHPLWQCCIACPAYPCHSAQRRRRGLTSTQKAEILRSYA